MFPNTQRQLPESSTCRAGLQLRVSRVMFLFARIMSLLIRHSCVYLRDFKSSCFFSDPQQNTVAKYVNASNKHRWILNVISQNISACQQSLKLLFFYRKLCCADIKNSNYACNCCAETQTTAVVFPSCQMSESCWPFPELERYKYKYNSSSRQVTNPFSSRIRCVERYARKDDVYLSKAALVRAVFSSGFRLLPRDGFKGVSLFQASNFQRNRRKVWDQNATGRLLGLDVQPRNADEFVEVYSPWH